MTPIRTAVFLFLSAVTLLSTIQCDQNQSVTNPVRTIEIKALDEIVTDKAFHGLVVVMAAWCPPCREELPVIADLYRKYHDRGISIVAVGIDAGGPKEIQPLVDKLEIPFPVYWAGPAATMHYKIAGIPTLMIIDRGRQSEKIPGSHSRRFIEEKIQGLLATPKAAGAE